MQSSIQQLPVALWLSNAWIYMQTCNLKETFNLFAWNEIWLKNIIKQDLTSQKMLYPGKYVHCVNEYFTIWIVPNF